MRCYVYKGDKKEDHFLYLPQELDDQVIDEIPAALLALLGELHAVVSFELSVEKQLAQADPVQVISDIEQHGFYLQMPKKDMSAEEDQYFN